MDKKLVAGVGMGATICHWTDREPATVASVRNGGKTVVVRVDISKRTDANGMSESEEALPRLQLLGHGYRRDLRPVGLSTPTLRPGSCVIRLRAHGESYSPCQTPGGIFPRMPLTLISIFLQGFLRLGLKEPPSPSHLQALRFHRT